MSPEYAMEGLISEKSDVFSFGVLLLEIVSGKKNSNFYNEELSLSLLGYVRLLIFYTALLNYVSQIFFDALFNACRYGNYGMKRT